MKEEKVVYMKVKKGLTVSTDDFWYDLTVGGYLVPEEILEDEKDVVAVKKAVSVLKRFESSCKKQIGDFVR